MDALGLVRRAVRCASSTSSLAEHEAVFRALQAHDSDAAASAMAAHMATASARLSQRAADEHGDAGAA